MTIDSTRLDGIAARLADARSARRTMPVPGFDLSGESEAYQVQDLVARRLGAVEGWKVGAKAPGAPPRGAPLLAGTVRQTGQGARVPVSGTVGVEVELAFRFDDGFAAGATLGSDADILDRVSAARLAVELCAARWQAGADVPPLWNLADNLMNEALLVGPEIADWRAIDPAVLRARLVVNGAVIADQVAGLPSGDFRTVLAWQVRHCVTTRGGLRPGAIVTTGSWVGMPMIAPGGHCHAEFPGLASLDFTLEQAS